MIEFLKSLFCKHEYIYVGGIKNINITACRYNKIPRDEWKDYPESIEHMYMCKKCGKKKKIKV